MCQTFSPCLLSPWAAVRTGPGTKQDWTRQAARQLVAGLRRNASKGQFNLFYFGAMIEPTDSHRQLRAQSLVNIPQIRSSQGGGLITR